jgi:hypothetical protein
MVAGEVVADVDVALAAFGGGEPSGLGVSALTAGRPVTLLAPSATGSRPLQATTVTIMAQAATGKTARSMTL